MYVFLSQVCVLFEYAFALMMDFLPPLSLTLATYTCIIHPNRSFPWSSAGDGESMALERVLVLSWVCQDARVHLHDEELHCWQWETVPRLRELPTHHLQVALQVNQVTRHTARVKGLYAGQIVMIVVEGFLYSVQFNYLDSHSLITAVPDRRHSVDNWSAYISPGLWYLWVSNKHYL